MTSAKLSFLLLYFAQQVLVFKKVSLFLIGLITGLSLYYISQNFAINSSFDDVIRPDDQLSWYADNEIFKKTFPQYQNTALVVISSPSAQNAFTAGQLTYQKILASNHFDDVFAPEFMPFFESKRLLQMPTLVVSHYADSVKKQLPDLTLLNSNPNISGATQFFKKRLAKEAEIEALDFSSIQLLTSLQHTLNSIDQDAAVLPKFLTPLWIPDQAEMHYHLILVKGKKDFSAQLPNKVIVDRLYTIFASLNLPTDVSVRLTGETALANDEVQAGLSGVEIAGVISIFLLAVILFFGLKYKRVIFGVLTMLLIGVSWTLALGLYLVGPLNALSLIFMIMFFGLAIDFAIHFALRWIDFNEPFDQLKTYEKTVSDIGAALMLCVLTSSIAFLAFLPTAYNGLAQLGVISAVGMVVAFLLTLTFLPIWLSLFQHKRKLEPFKQKGFIFYIHSIKPMPTLVMAFMLACVGLFVIKDIQFDYSVLAMQNNQTEAMQTLNELQQNDIFTDYGIAVIAPDLNSLNHLIPELESLASVSKVATPMAMVPLFQQQKIDALQGVKSAFNVFSEEIYVNSVDNDLNVAPSLVALIELFELQKSNFFDEDSALLHSIHQALITIQNDPDKVNLFNALIKKGLRSDFQQLDRWLNVTPFDFKDIPKEIRHRFITDEGAVLINVMSAKPLNDRKIMTDFIEQVSQVAPNIAGRSVVEWGVGQVVKEAFVQATSLAIVCIFFILVCYFRQVLLPAIILMPITLTTIFTFSVIQFSSLSLNMANILVVPLIFGLGVDTALHVVHRYSRSTVASFLDASSTTRAVIISALTTIGTFFSLSFSPHKGAASIGILLSISILFLLLATLVILPALMMQFKSRLNIIR